MSPDSEFGPFDELAELVAEVRAWVDHQQGRGQHGYDPSTRLSVAASSPVSTGAEASVEAASSGPGPQAEMWASVAASARLAEDENSVTGDEGLRRIRSDLGDCRRCGLCTGRTQIVFGVGDPEADLVVVGEAPGFQEDRQGEPFVGPAGQMLDKMLENVIGVPRAGVYILNVVKCRPPKNRNPLPDEVAACMPFLERQIAALQPKVLLVLGTVAFKSLFDTSAGIMKSRGIWKEWRGIPTMPTFHPAYLLRQPQDKRKTFQDLKAVRLKYDELGGRR